MSKFDGVELGLALEEKEAEDMKAGATVVGGVKKDPSSRVSKKSLDEDVSADPHTACDVKRDVREY